MFHISKERLKLYILAVLMTASVVQVGILWSYQYHGFPINFLPGFFQRISMNTSSEKALEDYFKPYQISITDGKGINFAEYFILDSNDNNFSKLWNGAKECLKYVLREKKAERVDANEWYDLIDRNESMDDKRFTKLGIVSVFEFSGNIDVNLISWFFNIHNIQTGEIGGIHKFALAPEFDENYNNALYILEKDFTTGEEYVFKYIIERGETKLVANMDLPGIFRNISRDSTKGGFSAAGSLGNIKVPNDLLIVIPQRQFRNFDNLICRVPEILEIKDVDSLTERNKLGSVILGPDAGSCDSTDIPGGIKFQNTNNTYIMHDNGLLTYEFKSLSVYGDRGYIDDAFINALEFIHWRKDILSGQVDIYLAGVEVLKDSYRFIFDYKVNGLHVFFNFENESLKPVNHAIIIKANEKRVLEASWIFKEFKTVSNGKRYNVSFIDNQDKLYAAYREVFESSDMKIRDIDVAFVVKNDSDNQELQPSWIVETNDGNYYSVLLEKK